MRHQKQKVIHKAKLENFQDPKEVENSKLCHLGVPSFLFKWICDARCTCSAGRMSIAIVKRASIAQPQAIIPEDDDVPLVRNMLKT